jgi:hypothetical protein
MIIIRARLKPLKGLNSEYLSLNTKIKHLILNNDDENFDFVMDNNGVKCLKTFGVEHLDLELVNKKIPIGKEDSNILAYFKENGKIEICKQ